MSAFKKKVEAILYHPKKFFDQTFPRLVFRSSEDPLETVLLVLFSGAGDLEAKDFELLSRQCLDYPGFSDNYEYQYYYFAARGNFFRTKRALDYAQECYEKANRLSYQLNEPDLVVKSLSYLSVIHDMMKDQEMALYYAEQALGFIDTVEDSVVVGDAYNSFGLILRGAGNLTGAREAFERAVDSFRKVPRHEAHVNYCILLLNFAELLVQMGDWGRAEEYLVKGVDVAEEYDHHNYLSALLVTVADFYRHRGLWEQAYDYLRRYTLLEGGPVALGLDLDEAYNKTRLKEEVSTLVVLKKENQTLANRLEQLYRFIESSDGQMKNNREIFSRFEAALGGNELVTYYQPQWSYTEGRIIGAEALVRWIQPDGTLIYPDSFIGVIEESDLVMALTERVVKDSFALTRTVVDRFNPDFIISINIAPYQLTHQNLAAVLDRERLKAGLRPRNIEIEITERTFLENDPRALHQLEKLKELGVWIALDDFGSGFSSLACISQLPLDVVKVDRSLLMNIHDDPQSSRLLSGIVRLLHEMKLEVVAEGVETGENAAFLKELCCDRGQGFYYNRAVPADELLDYLEKSGGEGRGT